VAEEQRLIGERELDIVSCDTGEQTDVPLVAERLVDDQRDVSV
jgi:hypothetical protein